MPKKTPTPTPAPSLFEATKGTVAIVCAWCPELHIMKIPRESHDLIEILQQGSKRLVIRRNGVQLAVSHGICRGCAAKETKRAKVSE